MRKRMNKCGLLAAWLRYANLHLNKPQGLWNNVFWTDGIIEMFDQKKENSTRCFSSNTP